MIALTQELVAPYGPESIGKFVGGSTPIDPGDELIVHRGDSLDGEKLFRITTDGFSQARFTISKLNAGEMIVDPDARQWVLEARTATFGPGTRLSGLLLGPSILGETLYGAAKSPGPEAEKKFGTISCLNDNLLKRLHVMVSMPRDSYKGIGGLVVVRHTIDAPSFV
ncbi:MAG TPA: hypothetical protein VIH90_04200 [Candidatus Saccharimonadales bacterium]